jgi:transcriptional regulator with PAS, ATPase and Fis domain
MLESELFGHAKGAFTDAYKDKKGLFEKADLGTIFLDEIGDITTDVQIKLLRVLQEGEFLPLGSEKIKKLDVRIITSTNRNLHDRVKEGKFREDLFYRINVINIHMPPLRERKDDIRRLSVYFANEYAAKVSKSINGLTDAAFGYLEEKRWDGNVRELKNTIYQGVVFSKGEYLDVGDLKTGEESAISGKTVISDATGDSLKESRENLLKEFEVDYIKKALANSGGNISKAAAECGLSRQSFQYLMKKYGVKVEK